MSSAIIRPKATAQMGELITNFRVGAAGEDRDQQLDGRRRPGRKRWPSSRRSTRAPAIPANISIIRTLEVRARRPARQCHALGRIRLGSAAVAAAQAGRPEPVGHAAADQQRLLRPDAATRSPSRPPSCSRPISTPMPIPPPITAASARPSAMRSATASTIRAASSTRKGKLRDWWTPASRQVYNAARRAAGRAI